MRNFPRRSWALPALALILALGSSGCATLARTDLATNETEENEYLRAREGSVRGSLMSQLFWYFPNRFVDFLEIFNTGVGVGLSTGLIPLGSDSAIALPVLRAGDKYNLGAGAGVGAGLAWSGRGYHPLVYGWQYGYVVGDRWEIKGKGYGMPLKKYEVGLYVFPGAKLTIVLDEAWDFIAGLANLDPNRDDFDRRPPGEAAPYGPPEPTGEEPRPRPPRRETRRGPVTLRGLRGGVEVQISDQAWRRAEDGEPLVHGARLRTARDGYCEVVVPALDAAFEGRNYIEVFEDSAIELRRGGFPGTWDVLLVLGEVELQFAEDTMNEWVRVEIPDEGSGAPPGRPVEESGYKPLVPSGK